jgi:KDO2-lipid IV(A) lauroyltransferase
MAEKGALQTNTEYALARLVIWFFRALPFSLAMTVGRSVGRLGFWFPKLRRTGERNLELAFPDLSQSEREDLLRGCFENLGRLLAVFSHFRDSDPSALKESLEADGLANLQMAQQSGRGVILFTGHIGAWELSSFGLSLCGHPLSFLVRRIDNSKIESFVDRSRTHQGNRTIDKRSAAREMLQILQKGDTLGILVDLNTLERESIFVNFFEVPAATTFMVAKLALRTGASVLPVFAPWDETKRKFLLRVEPPLSVERTGNEEEDVRRLTQQMTATVERYVRNYPDQWLWIHRRWKTRPPGGPDIY